MRVENNQLILNKGNNETEHINIPIEILNDQNPYPIEPFVVFDSVTEYLVTDLKAQFLLQGRGHRSPCRCLKCKADSNSWTIFEKEGQGWNKLLTDHDVERIATLGFQDDFGFECRPLWPIPISQCLIP